MCDGDELRDSANTKFMTMNSIVFLKEINFTLLKLLFLLIQSLII